MNLKPQPLSRDGDRRGRQNALSADWCISTGDDKRDFETVFNQVLECFGGVDGCASEDKGFGHRFYSTFASSILMVSGR